MNFGVKRKRDDDDYLDEDSEEELGRQVLPVANLPNDFDGEPMDGLQYLFTVRRNARSLPHTTRAMNPYATPEVLTPVVSESHSAMTTPEHASFPSLEWRESFVSHFKNFRKNFAQPTINVQRPASNNHFKTMPDKKERHLWWLFLAGRPQSEWNPPKAPKANRSNVQNGIFGRGMRGFRDDPEEYEVELDHGSSETWRVNDEGEVEQELIVDPSDALPTPHGSPRPQAPAEPGIVHRCREPTPSLMQDINHRYALHLLMYFTHWMNLHSQQSKAAEIVLTDTHARWMFSLLARLDDFISADEMNLLRNLARACMVHLKNALLSRCVISTGDSTEEGEVSTKMDPPASMSRDLWTDISAMLADVQTP